MKPNIFWWEPQRDSLPIQFCDNTSLHGLRYIGQPKRNMVERIFWLLAFVIGIIIACVLINDIWIKYKTSPIITTFGGVPAAVYQVPFPAITICNVNNVEKDKAMKIIQEGYSGKLADLAKVELLEHICSAFKVSFSQKFGFTSNGTSVPEELLSAQSHVNGEDALNMTIQEFLNVNAQTCEDMLLLCLWQNTVYDCTSLFQPIETDFGKCCTFNMIPRTLLYTDVQFQRDSPRAIKGWRESKINNDEQWMPVDELAIDEQRSDRQFPRRAAHAGQSRGLSVLLNPGLDQYFCSAADYDGHKFSAHQPLAGPDVDELGCSIPPNTETFVSITPDIVKAEPSLRGIDVDIRKCYFDGEFQLGYFQYYTEENCLEECRSNMTYKKCKCVHYFMPRDAEIHDICGQRSFECALNVSKLFSANGHELKEYCGFCRPTCNEIHYETEVHNAPIRNLNIWLKAASGNESRLNITDTNKWTSMKVSIAHFYFGSETTYPKLRKELFGFTDLLASTGGILGLCLGFSALSLLEILYFVTIRFICTVLRKRKYADIENAIGENELTTKGVDKPKFVKLQKKRLDQQILYPNFFMREMQPAYYRHKGWSNVYNEK